MSRNLDIATKRLERADKLVGVGKVLLVLYFVAVTIAILVQQFVVIQTQQSALEQSMRDNAQQHRRTQEYIKCIGATQLLPLSQRSVESFERCGVDVDPLSSSGRQQPSQDVSTATPATPAPQAVLPPVQQTSPEPATQEPTISSPPDPEPIPERGLVGDVLDSVLAIPRALLGGN